MARSPPCALRPPEPLTPCHPLPSPPFHQEPRKGRRHWPWAPRNLSSPLRQKCLGNEGIFGSRLRWRVDPDGLRESLRYWRSVEAFRVGLVGSVEGLCPLFEDLLGSVEVDVGRSQQSDARVPVFVVVPVEEGSAEGLGLVD